MTAPAEHRSRPTKHPQCGTAYGCVVHSRRGERSCRPCLDAHAKKQRERNQARKAAGLKDPPEVAKKQRIRMKARSWALAELARRNKDEYDALYRRAHHTITRQEEESAA